MEQLKVLKFGGTSVGSADAMNDVIDIIEKNEHPQIIVLSAMSGTTNALVQIKDALSHGDKESATAAIHQLEYRYVRVLTDLYPNKPDRDEARTLLRPCFSFLRSQADAPLAEIDTKEILAQGELISSRLFSLICRIRGLATKLVSALEFMRLDEHGDPDMEEIEELWQPFVSWIDNDCQILITQGYICRNAAGYVDNLKRGGSDYTATIIGSITRATEVQIWTDIDGVRNNDPRIVPDTKPIRYLSYREAAELAFFGAKILHPTCVLPVEERRVPLHLKYTMDPMAPGTTISERSSGQVITAIAAKDDITCIKVYSDRMLQAYGFLSNLFGIFARYRTSVDMISTSEVSVSLTIDDTQYLDQIKAEILKFAEIEVDHDYSIICIVGSNMDTQVEVVKQVINCIDDVPIRMISVGGSKINVSLLVPRVDKERCIRALHRLFDIGIFETTQAHFVE